MGQVYRARDGRLGREVAVKVLPGEFAANPERRRRFEQESRAAGALNHPNIVAVYDVGEQDGVSYIVSELVEGESLREVIHRGPVPARKALDLAAQIADGLSAAHAAGIVHRDLKPENVMLTRDGRPKILDFGLARYQPPAPAAGEQGTVTVTQPGVVMGTVGYMSPEQVTGAPADARSDIFSLGAILFEMLTGRIPFERATSVETMSAILREDPPDLPGTIAPAVRQIVAHCLEKEPVRRYQSAQDLAFNLRSAAGASMVSGASPKLPAPPPRRLVLPFATGALAVLLVYTIAALLMRAPGADLASYRFTPLATDSPMQSTPVWSPDGKSVAYIRDITGAPNEILVRSLDSLVPVQVASADARSIFWSVDGTRLFYVLTTGVWSVSRAGGAAVQVVAGDYLDASLSPDGKALVLWLETDRTNGPQAKLWISSPPGAPPRKYDPVVFQEQGSYSPVYLRFAPDGRQILLTRPSNSGPEMWLLPFPDGPAAHGKARRIFRQALAPAVWPPFLSWMPDARHVVMSFATGSHPQPRLWMADTRNETMEPITADEGRKISPAVAPDGKTIAYTAEYADFDVVLIPVNGDPVRPLVATGRDEMFPAWSPVGPLLAYVTNRSGPQEIWVRNGEQGSDRPLVTQRDFSDDENLEFWTLTFSPDGHKLAYVRNSSQHLGTIWVSPVDGGTPVRITDAKHFDFAPSWSPDGDWLLYFSSAGGLMKVRVGGTEPAVLLRDRGCRNPAQWSPDGQWIACAEKDGVALLTPEGKKERTVGNKPAFITWSKDGKQIYALLNSGGANWQLDAIDVKSGEEKRISDLGSGHLWAAPNGNSFPLSLSSDGKTLASQVINQRSEIWMLEGFQQPRGMLSRLWVR
jgi:serine/threonine protein kinase